MSGLHDVRRIGYGAMQLAGPGVMGPPQDPEAARRVLLRAVELGVDHIDTSDFYGPHTVNELIRETLSPYPAGLVLVTKVGARRDAQGGWLSAFTPEEVRTAVHDNLERLGTDRLGAVNLRVVDGPDTPVEEQWTVLAELQAEGLVGEIGLSTVTAAQVAAAQRIAPVTCVQNEYNIAQRGDDALLDDLTGQGVLYVPYFPLGGFAPLDVTELDRVGAAHGATGRQVALAWLLRRSPRVLLIPGTRSVAHLEENLAAADLHLTDDDLATLDALHP